MPEREATPKAAAAADRTGGVAAEAVEDTALTPPRAACQASVAVPRGQAGARTSWVFYGLGLTLQVFLWFLLFLALVIAIAVGGELTEFRYVGF